MINVREKIIMPIRSDDEFIDAVTAVFKISDLLNLILDYLTEDLPSFVRFSRVSRSFYKAISQKISGVNQVGKHGFNNAILPRLDAKHQQIKVSHRAITLALTMNTTETKIKETEYN